MRLAVSEATVADLEALLPLLTAYRVFYRQEPDAVREREFVERNLRERRSTIFIARDAETRNAVGFTQLFQTYSTVWLGPSLILEDLFVKPELRGVGIATALLQRAQVYAREIGAVGMFLETAMDNETAQRVYERAGWTREDRFYKYNAKL
jgi:ribosomal protein S18 acetylase RimI-like enzyme